MGNQELPMGNQELPMGNQELPKDNQELPMGSQELPTEYSRAEKEVFGVNCIKIGPLVAELCSAEVGTPVKIWQKSQS